MEYERVPTADPDDPPTSREADALPPDVLAAAARLFIDTHGRPPENEQEALSHARTMIASCQRSQAAPPEALQGRPDVSTGVPDEVLAAAHNIFLQHHGRPAATDSEALAGARAIAESLRATDNTDDHLSSAGDVALDLGAAGLRDPPCAGASEAKGARDGCSTQKSAASASLDASPNSSSHGGLDPGLVPPSTTQSILAPYLTTLEAGLQSISTLILPPMPKYVNYDADVHPRQRQAESWTGSQHVDTSASVAAGTGSGRILGGDGCRSTVHPVAGDVAGGRLAGDAMGVDALRRSLKDMMAVVDEREAEINDLQKTHRHDREECARLRKAISEAQHKHADGIAEVTLTHLLRWHAASTQAIEMLWAHGTYPLALTFTHSFTSLLRWHSPRPHKQSRCCGQKRPQRQKPPQRALRRQRSSV